MKSSSKFVTVAGGLFLFDGLTRKNSNWKLGEGTWWWFMCLVGFIAMYHYIINSFCWLTSKAKWKHRLAHIFLPIVALLLPFAVFYITDTYSGGIITMFAAPLVTYGILSWINKKYEHDGYMSFGECAMYYAGAFILVFLPVMMFLSYLIHRV